MPLVSRAVVYCCYVLLFICNGLSFESFQFSDKATILCNLEKPSASSQNLWILINARSLYQLNTSTITNRILIENIPLASQRYSIAVYHRNKKEGFNLLGINDIDINDTISKVSPSFAARYSAYLPSINYSKPFVTLSSPAFSTYYTTINYYEAMSKQNITYNMKELNMDISNVPNFETVILTDDNVTIYDLNNQWAWTIDASKHNSSVKPVQQNPGYVMQTPSKYGYYCVYTNPPKKNLVPDCPNAINVIKEHAQMFYSSGIDFIMPDDTNHDGGPTDTKSYILQIRPNELILETWSELRKNGTNTPQFAIWNLASGTEWQTNLQFYNNYTDLIYTGGKPKKAYFVVNSSGHVPDQSIVSKIESNGGKNDIKVIYMWDVQIIDSIDAGTWTDWLPCYADKGIYTNSMEYFTDCNAKMTRNSYLGSQMSASFRAGSHEGSLALSTATKLNGRTFQLTIKDALKLKPDHVFYPSWNEHHCGAHATSDSNVWSNGLYKDKGRNIYFNENYGTESSRTFEPSKEAGDYYFRLMQSCNRVLRLQYYFGNLLSAVPESICNVANEICCNNITEYNDIYSLKTSSGSDYLLSNNATEVNQLISSKKYQQICALAPYANTSVFCEGHTMSTNEQHQGPFILYTNSKNPYGQGSLSVINIARNAIYRCIDTAKNIHFIANNKNCDGVTTNYKLDVLLGYAAKKPSTAMARRIMRCINNNGVYYNTIDDGCYENNSKNALLGFAL